MPSSGMRPGAGAAVASAAEAAGCTRIVTRNLAGFSSSPVAAQTPEELRVLIERLLRRRTDPPVPAGGAGQALAPGEVEEAVAVSGNLTAGCTGPTEGAA